MTRTILFLALAVILFSAAAGGSWYLQYQQNKDSELAKNADEKAPKTGPGAAASKKSGTESSPNRPLVRPPTSPESERISQLAATLQQQQESLKSREQLVVREKQMNILHDEVKKEHKKLDTVRKEIQAELVLLQEKLDQLEKRANENDKDRQKADVQKDEIRRAMLEVNSLESKNLKQLAGIYDKMDPEAASQSIQQMVDTGKLDMAVTILINMGNRQAATLLGEIARQDPSVAVQLFDRMRLFKAPAPTSGK